MSSTGRPWRALAIFAALGVLAVLVIAGCKSSAPEYDLSRLAAPEPRPLALLFAQHLASNRNRRLWWFERGWDVAEVSELPAPIPPPQTPPRAERVYKVVLSSGGAASSRVETDVVFVGISTEFGSCGWRVDSWGGAP